MKELLKSLKEAYELVWINPEKKATADALSELPFTEADIEDARARLERFAPVIMHYFPETRKTGGLIESPLTSVPEMKERLNMKYSAGISGRLFLKRDSDLAVAGSVKARGGIYEVLKHTETLALENKILRSTKDDYLKLTKEKARKLFAGYKMQVGSTGNLGLSIGIMSAALGYQAIVHMSMEAKDWKKELLREKGVDVREYEGDYGAAVAQGRAESDADPCSYFVDDEKSEDLFLGYAVAGKRLQKQLDDAGVTVDREHPLCVYIPCGVGGAPGGICYGLKQIYGDQVHVFYVEPTRAPCMLLGLASGLHEKIAVQDIGLSGKTLADGLAVSRPSGLICRVSEPLVSGEFTLQDVRLNRYLRDLWDTERIFIEPSACAAFQGPVKLMASEEGRAYLKANGLDEYMHQATHIVWATGGKLVPKTIRNELLNSNSGAFSVFDAETKLRTASKYLEEQQSGGGMVEQILKNHSDARDIYEAVKKFPPHLKYALAAQCDQTGDPDLEGIARELRKWADEETSLTFDEIKNFMDNGGFHR